MSIAAEGKMLLSWSFWPKELSGSTGDPRSQQLRERVVDSMKHALEHTNDLRDWHGDDLICVDVTIRLVG